MKKLLLIGGSIIALIGLVIAGCELGGSGGGSIPSVPPVSEVSIPDGERASVSHFSTPGSSTALPATDTDVALTVFGAIGFLSEPIGYLGQSGWQPTNGTFNEDPTPEQSPLSVSADVSNEQVDFQTDIDYAALEADGVFDPATDPEYIGQATIDAAFALYVSWTTGEPHGYPDSLDGSFDADAAFTVDSSSVYAENDTSRKILAAYFRAVAALNAAADISYAEETVNGQTEYSPSTIGAAYSASIDISAALSVENTNAGEYGGNFIVNLTVNDNESLLITESMLSDETGEELEAYLREKLTADDLTVTIDVYDGTSFKTRHHYTIEELAAIIEQAAGSAAMSTGIMKVLDVR